MTYDLPVPPSSNNMFFNTGRGRAITPEYKAWREEAGLMLRRQGIAPFIGRAEVVIDIDDTVRGDADNRSKACLDLLVAHGVLRDDSKKYVKRVSVGWKTGIGACRVTVRPVESVVYADHGDSACNR